MNVVRQLSLVKGHHRFVFRYQAGREAQVIDCFADMASDGSPGVAPAVLLPGTVRSRGMDGRQEGITS